VTLALLPPQQLLTFCHTALTVALLPMHYTAEVMHALRHGVVRAIMGTNQCRNWRV
jgi:hypothetical protein